MKKKKESKNGEMEKSGKKVKTQIRAGMNKAELIDAMSKDAKMVK